MKDDFGALSIFDFNPWLSIWNIFNRIVSYVFFTNNLFCSLVFSFKLLKFSKLDKFLINILKKITRKCRQKITIYSLKNIGINNFDGYILYHTDIS